ncbi:nucleotidyl transferase AbiEii/AbiGii toxin family protein [Streptomyces sp. NPDC005125]
MRGFFFQRLTARVFSTDPDGWLLKGGQALLVRYPARARLSNDIDLQRLEGNPDEALTALLEAATTDLGDHLNFVPRQLKTHGNDAEGVNQAFDSSSAPARSTPSTSTSSPNATSPHPRN